MDREKRTNDRRERINKGGRPVKGAAEKLKNHSKIDATLRRNNYEERQSLIRPNPEPIISTESSGGNLINGSLGLFTPSNQPEEQQLYDPYLRNKKKKKQHKINWQLWQTTMYSSSSRKSKACLKV